MLTELESIQSEGISLLATISDEDALETFRVAFLGKKGKLTALAARMREVPADQKAAVGAR